MTYAFNGGKSRVPRAAEKYEVAHARWRVAPERLTLSQAKTTAPAPLENPNGNATAPQDTTTWTPITATPTNGKPQLGGSAPSRRLYDPGQLQLG